MEEGAQGSAPPAGTDKPAAVHGLGGWEAAAHLRALVAAQAVDLVAERLGPRLGLLHQHLMCVVGVGAGRHGQGEGSSGARGGRVP